MPKSKLKSLGKRIKTFFQKREAFRLLRKYHNEARSIEDRVAWAMNFGGPTNEKDSIAIINRALEGGINFIDTANVYNAGESKSEAKRS